MIGLLHFETGKAAVLLTLIYLMLFGQTYDQIFAQCICNLIWSVFEEDGTEVNRVK